MTNEQKELYDRIVATGRYNEEQLAKLRAGFEKPARKIDTKKSQLHLDMVGLCQSIEKSNPDEFQVDWSPEDEEGNAYIYIIAGEYAMLSGKEKTRLQTAIHAADCVTFKSAENDEGKPVGVVITLGFMGIIVDPSKE